jgi:hypothetical protein
MFAQPPASPTAVGAAPSAEAAAVAEWLALASRPEGVNARCLGHGTFQIALYTAEIAAVVLVPRGMDTRLQEHDALLRTIMHHNGKPSVAIVDRTPPSQHRRAGMTASGAAEMNVDTLNRAIQSVLAERRGVRHHIGGVSAVLAGPLCCLASMPRFQCTLLDVPASSWSLPEACACIHQLVHAITDLMDAGLFAIDMKSDNIMLDPWGKWRIMDVLLPAENVIGYMVTNSLARVPEGEPEGTRISGRHVLFGLASVLADTFSEVRPRKVFRSVGRGLVQVLHKRSPVPRSLLRAALQRKKRRFLRAMVQKTVTLRGSWGFTSSGPDAQQLFRQFLRLLTTNDRHTSTADVRQHAFMTSVVEPLARSAVSRAGTAAEAGVRVAAASCEKNSCLRSWHVPPDMKACVSACTVDIVPLLRVQGGEQDLRRLQSRLAHRVLCCIHKTLHAGVFNAPCRRFARKNPAATSIRVHVFLFAAAAMTLLSQPEAWAEGFRAGSPEEDADVQCVSWVVCNVIGGWFTPHLFSADSVTTRKLLRVMRSAEQFTASRQALMMASLLASGRAIVHLQRWVRACTAALQMTDSVPWNSPAGDVVPALVSVLLRVPAETT